MGLFFLNQINKTTIKKKKDEIMTFCPLIALNKDKICISKTMKAKNITGK